MCAILLDTKGPEIRTGKLKDGKEIELVAGQVSFDSHVSLLFQSDCFIHEASTVPPQEFKLINDFDLIGDNTQVRRL